MKTIFSEKHKLRDAKTELYGGELVLPFERPSRAEFIHDRIVEMGLGPIVPPTEYGLAFGGNSIITAPDASIMARAGKDPALLIADLNDTKTIDPNFLPTYQQDYRKVSP